MSKMDERVACVTANSVLSLGLNLPGLISMQDTQMISAMSNRAEFRRRGDVEEDESVLQIIPYVYICNSSGSLFAYARTPKGGEARLRGKVSIGVGGHINPSDDDGTPEQRHFMVREAALREINEEVRIIPGASELHIGLDVQGLMLLDYTAVDRVHLGVIYSLHLPRDVRFEARDGEVKSLGWLTPKTIREYNNLENWSKVLLPRIKEGKITDAR